GMNWLDMDVACAQLDRFLQKVVDRANHGRTAREIAQTFDIVVTRPECFLALALDLGVVTAETLIEGDCDVFE
ncbi:hypothetical protein, partial [Salmonella enterica]|uniref:hypothetical protein n=1 Tax=Salmonella enterica TaxID=28901 RepID=UPI00165472FD